jgi:4-hydroxythreonine-4-phosphate dehydrogenase
MDYLRRAVELALAGGADAVVFAPLNKEAMKMAGLRYHDEYGYFAELCGVEEEDYTVLMVGPHFSLASVTLHLPLGEAVRSITAERVLATVRRSHQSARAAGIPRPRIGVAALNPHAGENGTLGTEERDAIRPAIEAARDEGIDAHGPFPADTFFMTAEDSAYDVYVGMYHDQGRIALKMLDFGRASTMAEGLPVAIVTVGHGSAYDIAGKGIARHENMVQTLLLAARRASRQQ